MGVKASAVLWNYALGACSCARVCDKPSSERLSRVASTVVCLALGAPAPARAYKDTDRTGSIHGTHNGLSLATGNARCMRAGLLSGIALR